MIHCTVYIPRKATLTVKFCDRIAMKKKEKRVFQHFFLSLSSSVFAIIVFKIIITRLMIKASVGNFCIQYKQHRTTRHSSQEHRHTVRRYSYVVKYVIII